jgi:hypothetical protein
MRIFKLRCLAGQDCQIFLVVAVTKESDMWQEHYSCQIATEASEAPHIS